MQRALRNRVQTTGNSPRTALAGVRESLLANHLIGIAIEIGVVKSLAKYLSISIAISNLARNISRTPMALLGLFSIDGPAPRAYTHFYAC